MNLKLIGLGYIFFYVSVDNDNNEHLLSICFASDIVLGSGIIELKKWEALYIKEFSVKRKQTTKHIIYLPYWPQ